MAGRDLEAAPKLDVDCSTDSIKHDLNSAGLDTTNAAQYGVPFSHLFTALEISPIELEISPIELEISTIDLQISTIHLEISPNRLNCRSTIELEISTIQLEISPNRFYLEITPIQL